MVKLTVIARITDGLPLAEGMDTGLEEKELDFYKQQAKSLFKRLSHGQNQPSRMSVETGPYFFHYLIEGRVCYLTLCDRSYPKKLAFQYLEELQREFERLNHSQIETVARPYAFVKFDIFIQKTRKLYLDTRTQRNLSRLNDELYEVQQIMTRNIQEVLGVGDKLDRKLSFFSSSSSNSSSAIVSSLGFLTLFSSFPEVSQLSTRLTAESRIFSDKARDLNRQALIRKWAPVVIVLSVVLIFLFMRRSIWG
ncbi:25.3 kDa vesicle transport protein isoform X1 [Selaginella moellendorffii]|uniref:25.3 kDa vesicle transport protein isoform X1 n=1 Tax=Selaginella moellendorffii TaxID=88036 RepID=UPI000D1C62D4|nr:25.3 kDa vesicle transport protein isoform X1 [Selaginella moellendorffii]|eukprot:XP_024540394.1 25.3 kDa vesicle transport protein isoform X1 [Selaginella moellendorffii]